MSSRIISTSSNASTTTLLLAPASRSSSTISFIVPTPSENSNENEHTKLNTVDLSTPPARIVRADRCCRRPLFRTAIRDLKEITTVVVGTDDSNGSGRSGRKQASYIVHKDLLKLSSPYFAAAFDGKRFAEGEDNEVRLPETNPEAFEWFLQWVYTGSLTAMPASTHPLQHPDSGSGPSLTLSGLTTEDPAAIDVCFDGDLRNRDGQPKYFLLLEIWALADQLLATPLANLVLSNIARLSEMTNSVPTPTDTYILYEQLRANSPVRKLVLDLFIFKKTDRLLETHPDDWHPGFMRDLLVRLKRADPEDILRHPLVSWQPRSISASKGCQVCKTLIGPGCLARRCCRDDCGQAFCVECLIQVEKGESRSLPTETSGCKPWIGQEMCRRYHEHENGDACG